MSSENGWIRLEGKFKVRMARCQVLRAMSGVKGNVKQEWLSQMGRAMSNEND